MPSRENKDGSVTTWADDVDEPKEGAEAKVVTSPDSRPPKSRSQAESK
jgi:hypothetical protein